MPYIPVGKLNDIPFKSGLVVEIGKFEIALFRLNDTVYATSNVCPHQGAGLADGELEGEEIYCPWHRWCFNIKDGVSPLNPKLKVKTYPVKMDGEEISLLLPDEYDGP